MERVRKAMSYGPIGYPEAAISGVVLGSAAFVLYGRERSSYAGAEKLPLWLLCALAGATLLVLIAMAVNYIVGKRIRDFQEIQKKLFGDGTLPPPRPAPPEGRIFLGKKRRDASAASDAAEPPAD